MSCHNQIYIELMDYKAKIKTWGRSRAGKIVIGIVVVLLAMRIALPYVMLHYANKELAGINGYYGHINDLSVSLFRGAYTLDSIYINKTNEGSDAQMPFFSSALVDLSLEWGSLFQGKIAGEIVLIQPNMKFTENKVELDDVAADTSDFRQLIHDFMPIQINRFEVQRGHIVYADYTTNPEIIIEATEVNAVAHNLKNTYNKKEILPASLQASANVHNGTALLNMRLNPLSKHSDFDMDFELKNTSLPELNPFFKAYAKADVNKGVFSMYMEAATKDGEFVGYVKPFIENLDVLDWKGQDKNDAFLHKIWEGVVGFGGKLFKNRKTDNIATKIPLSGTLGDKNGIQSNTLTAVFNIVKNAFFEAISDNFDNNITINSAVSRQDEK